MQPLVVRHVARDFLAAPPPKKQLAATSAATTRGGSARGWQRGSAAITFVELHISVLRTCTTAPKSILTPSGAVELWWVEVGCGVG